MTTNKSGTISPKLKNLLIKPLLALIWLYQRLISPLLGPRCRFYPSCSNYAKGCLIQHGLFKGGYLATRRCLKCHPFHPGGIDPVPENRKPEMTNALNPNNLGESP